jgi:hypothetical protein
MVIVIAGLLLNTSIKFMTVNGVYMTRKLTVMAERFIRVLA